MNYKFTFDQLRKLSIATTLILGALVSGQNNGPALEMATGAGNPTGNGPVLTTVINFQNNTDNPGGTTFTTHNPLLSATYTISNPRLTSSVNSSPLNIGHNGAAAPIFDLMNSQGVPANGNFTSASSANGTGVMIANNRAVRMYVMTYPLRVAARSTSGIHALADLTITFNRPVNNPVIHLGGLGGTANSGLGFSGHFNITASNVALANLSLTRLSGIDATGFQTSGLTISNGSAVMTGSGTGSGSGSVRINGTGITTLTFTVSIKGDGTQTATTAWADSNTDTTTGEAFTMGFSAAESDIQLTKTMANTAVAVGGTTSFTVTARNNGPSNNANINITDVLPSGYNYNGAATVSSGVFNQATGVWNISLLNNAASATLTIPVTVMPSGNYTNTATLTSSTVVDSRSFNNSATAARLLDSDGDGIFDDNDLDDDNDGIPDTLEKGICGTPGTVTSMTGYKAGVYDGVPNVDAWAEMNASTTFPTASFNQIATFDYNEFAATQNAFNLNFTASGNVSATTPKVSNYQGIALSPTQHEYAIVFSKIINADEVGTYQYTLTNADNHVFVYKNGLKVASRQNVYSSVIPVANFVTISVVLGDRIDVVLVEEDVNNTYITMSATKTAGQCIRNTDGDGIPDHLDLDSDGDSCFDAIEGDENVIPSQLNANGSINTVTTGGLNAQGIPNLVNTGGIADTGSDAGQGTGDSHSSSANTQCIDSDGDGIPNNLDLDDDNDGILDTVEDACATEGSPVYSNDFGTGAAATIDDPFVIGHTRVTGDPGDGFYIVTTSGARTATYTRTNLIAELDAGNPNITAGSTNGRYLMININSPVTVNQAIYRTGSLPVTIGTRYRFRLDLAGLADGAVDIPDLQISLKDTSGNILATANSGALGMANDDVWRRLSLNFVATTTSVVLEIVNLQGNANGGNDTGIDNIVLAPLTLCDADNDGIPNSQDLDSDGDGCFDAIEGSENVLPGQLNPNGSINTTSTGGFGTAFGINAGVPNAVNSGGAADIGSNVGQGIGDSQNSAVNIQCLDTDGDGYTDNIDLDDDNDGVLDCIEKGLSGGTVSTVFQLNGNATQLAANEARLTSDAATQAGQMWSRGKVDFGKSFTLSYRANLGSKDAAGADGIAAVFHNSPAGLNATGSTGSGIGAQGIANGLVLEIDTYFNEGTFGDIVNDHGQIWMASNQTATGFLTTATDLGNLEDGAYHNVVITWNSTTKNLSYTVDGINAGLYTFPAANPITSYFGGASKVFFGYTASTGGSFNEQKVSFVNLCSDLPVELDTDDDGIPDHLDLDSDNDGCFDSLEGDENVTVNQLNTNGSINTTTTGGLGSTFNVNSGVPNLVNSGGTADIGADIGQGIGDSQNALSRACSCYRKPILNAGTNVPVQHGITALSRAGGNAVEWPTVRQSAWTVLEANTKGFVVNKVAFENADNDASTPTTPIGIPMTNYVEGMMVYDTTANCLKIYNGTFWNCYSTQSCQ